MVIRESIEASVYSYKVIEFVLDNLKDKKDGKPKTIIEWEKNNEWKVSGTKINMVNLGWHE